MKERPKKVLMIAPTPFFADRGCHIRILNSYLRLKRRKAKVVIVTYPIGRDIEGVTTKRIISLPGYKKTDSGFSPYRPFLDCLLLIKSAKEARHNRSNLIYAHLHEGALIGIILKKIFKTRVIFDSQGSLVGELIAQGTIRKEGMAAKIIFWLEKYITKNVDEIITSTKALKEYIENEIGVSVPVRVIEDLPDRSIFNSKVPAAKLKLPRGKKIVVYLGGLQRYKGIDYLIEAIPFVDHKFHFLIMGYPVERCQKLAKRLGVEDRITFTGQIPYEQAPSFLKLGDLAVSPKTLESKEANAKLYNYLAMGLKVVCFDSVANREILEDNGIYAREKDSQDLAEKINSFVQ